MLFFLKYKLILKFNLSILHIDRASLIARSITCYNKEQRKEAFFSCDDKP